MTPWTAFHFFFFEKGRSQKWTRIQALFAYDALNLIGDRTWIFKILMLPGRGASMSIRQWFVEFCLHHAYII